MKKIVFLLVIFFICLNFVSAESLNINAKSAILIDQNTGKVLYKLNENEKRPMASMTKVMSLILIMEKIDDGTLKYEDEVLISDVAASMGGSQIFLQPGDKYTVRDLLKSIAMASANDAVVALAEKTYGSLEIFIQKMNDKAKELGLNNTHFINVHGLDEDGHYSSAYDMAMMARELLNHEDILKFTSVYEEYIKRPDGSQIWLVNTNKLVRFYEGVDGLKTGYTDKAGYCLTSTIKKNNLRLISVVMGEDTVENRSQDTVKLLNYGFSNYKVNLIKSKNEVIGKVKVNGGKKDYINVSLKNDAIELLNVNDKVSKYHFEIDSKNINAPVKKGDVVGKIKILDEKGSLISKGVIVSTDNVQKANIFDLFKRNLRFTLSFS